MKTLKMLLESKGISQEVFDAYDAEKQAGIFNELNESNATAFKALEEDTEKNKEEILKANKELLEIVKEQKNALNKSLKSLGLEIKKVKSEGAQKVEGKTFAENLATQLKANVEKLTASKNGTMSEAQSNSVQMEVKVAGTMTSANISGGNVPLEDRIEGFNLIPSRKIRLLDIMAQRSTSSNLVSWVYQANKDGAAGQTGEGLTKNQIDFEIVVDEDTVKKSTAFIKVSTEMLDDVSWIQSEIEGELLRELEKAIETQAYSGDGTGLNHTGVRTVASAFSAGSFAGAVDNANEVDVLVVAMNQIAIAQEGDALPNWILMHPTDVTALKLEKLSASDKRYVERLMLAGSTLMVDGVPIIPTTLVTEGEYLIGDFGLSILVTRQAITFDIGLDADDFTKNLRTILAEYRGLTIVKNNDRSGFVKGVFATDAAALETA